jgi:hypothetical protein
MNRPEAYYPLWVKVLSLLGVPALSLAGLWLVSRPLWETGISRPQFLAGFALGSAVLYQCSIAWLALKSLQTRIVVLENGARLISNGKEEQFSWNDFGPTKEFTFAGVSKLTRRDGRSVLYVFDNMRNLQAVKSSIAVVQH